VAKNEDSQMAIDRRVLFFVEHFLALPVGKGFFFFRFYFFFAFTSVGAAFSFLGFTLTGWAKRKLLLEWRAISLNL
jgi:hypothetical protein